MGAALVSLVSAVLLASPPAGPRLDFELKAVRENMKSVSRAPWFEPGGRWTVFDCTAGGVDFVIATGDTLARFGPAREEGRAALVALLAKTFAVPVAPPVPGSSGFILHMGTSGREVLSGGGFGPDDAPAPVVFGDDILGTLAPDTDGVRLLSLLEFALTPKKKKGWLRSDDARRLVTEVARGASKESLEWTPLGDAGAAFLGFVSDGRMVLSSKAGTATALDLVALDSRKGTPLGRLEGEVNRLECATPLKNGCVALAGGQLWSLTPQAPPRAIGPRVGASNVRAWLSPSGAWVALHTNTLCIPHGCPDELLVKNVARGTTVLKQPIEPRGFEGLGVTWKVEGHQDVLVVDSEQGLQRFVAPAFKPVAAKAGPATTGSPSPDGRLMLERRTTDGGAVDVIRDVASGAERRVEAGAQNLSWLDSRLLLARGQSMRVIDASTGEVRVTFTLPLPLTFIAVDPGLKWLLASMGDQLLIAPLPAGP